jgi:hypothetical protein
MWAAIPWSEPGGDASSAGGRRHLPRPWVTGTETGAAPWSPTRSVHPTPLGQAFAEYGRKAKTEHLVRVVDPVDDTYRRQMNRQLTVQESRHKLARDVCHGKRGTIHLAYRDGMEDQLGSLGLVLNAVVPWTTRYIDAAVAQLRAEDHEIRDEDIARLSPLKHRNLNGRRCIVGSVDALNPYRGPRSDRLGEFGERGGDPGSGRGVDGEFVVSAA